MHAKDFFIHVAASSCLMLNDDDDDDDDDYDHDDDCETMPLCISYRNYEMRYAMCKVPYHM